LEFKDTFFSKKVTINVHGTLIDLSYPGVMGIINITPDSFYPGSRFEKTDDILKRVAQIIDEGGKFIDIGAFSSRPGAPEIDEKTEKERLKPALSEICKKFPGVIISLDTYRASIAEWAVGEFGIGMINDISGGTMDKMMYGTISGIKVPYILMHMRGKPENMQEFTDYKHVSKEVIKELSFKVLKIKESGISDIIIDPGFGFSKTVNQNFQLLEQLEMFKIFELPILTGLSRKTMIYKVLGNTSSEALNGTTVLNTIALLKGVNILRVHDVKEAVEAIKLVSKLNSVQ
jgi:dihydropteroate synthase